MRIALFTGSLATGGAERQFALLGGELASRGHEVRFLTMETGSDDPSYEDLLGDVERRIMFKSRSPGPFRLLQLLQGWRPVRRELRAFRADVIYAALEWPDWLAAQAAASMSNRPAVVIGIRNSAEVMSWKRNLPLRSLAARGQFNAIVANSGAGLEEAHRMGIRSALEAVIPNGIDTVHFRRDPDAGLRKRAAFGIPGDVPCLGHVGRLSPMKDHKTLLCSFAALLESKPDAHLICVGDGPGEMRRTVQQLASALSISERVHWSSHEEDMPALYSALDVLVMSSCDGEGFPNAVAEAMACETVCAVTMVGEAEEIVSGSGMAVASRDPKALSRIMNELLNEPNRGAAARERIESQYGISRMLDSTEAILRKAVDSMNA